MFAAVLMWSTFAPKDSLPWFLEAVPALMGVVLSYGVSFRESTMQTPRTLDLALSRCLWGHLPPFVFDGAVGLDGTRYSMWTGERLQQVVAAWGAA